MRRGSGGMRVQGSWGEDKDEARVAISQAVLTHYPPQSPPLSLKNTSSVLSHMPELRSAVSTVSVISTVMHSNNL